MRILTVLGARPQFIKASPLSLALRQQHQEVLVHTGQHYDYGMSDVFFEELGIPPPDYHLGVGSGPHGAQTGAMLEAIEEVLQKERPHLVKRSAPSCRQAYRQPAPARNGVPRRGSRARFRTTPHWP